MAEEPRNHGDDRDEQDQSENTEHDEERPSEPGHGLPEKLSFDLSGVLPDFVEPEPATPVELECERPEPQFFHQVAEDPVPHRAELMGPVGRLTETHDAGLAHQVGQRVQVIQVTGGLCRV